MVREGLIIIIAIAITFLALGFAAGYGVRAGISRRRRLRRS
jgi:hypothetical protein